MADCPKCGRTLTVAGSCIKCGTLKDRSSWYAIAEENKQKDAQEEAARPKGKTRKPKAETNANRGDWYKAAGMETPELVDHDPDKPAPKMEGEVPISGEVHDWADVAKGRKDPPFKLIGGVIFVGACVVGMVMYANGGASEEAAQTAQANQVVIPQKNVQWDHSYGYRIDPPEGFKQVQLTGSLQADLPDFAKGLHGELTSMVAFRDATAGIDAYYFGEVKPETNLDSYAQRSIADMGKATPLAGVPDALKAFSTKGFLIDMGPRKALAYFVYAKPDRYLSAFILAPSTSFSGAQAKVESAARAFEVLEPDGPHPGAQFAAPEGQ